MVVNNSIQPTCFELINNATTAAGKRENVMTTMMGGPSRSGIHVAVRVCYAVF